MGEETGDVALGQSTHALSSKDFEVDFIGCTEYVGIGFVPAANARELVPTSYALAGDAENAIAVVRVVDCDGIAVDGKKPKAGKLAQIGIMIAGGDASADINNYTAWFATDLGQLKGKLTAAGVDADLDQLSFDFTPDGTGSGTIDIDVTPPHAPHFAADGTGIVPTSSPVPFVATWWFDGNHGTARMRTEFPAISFSGASVTVTTPAGSALADLAGSTSIDFGLLDSYNAFDEAHMVVTVD